ncbi:MAG: cupin domain-containing protein [Acidimicrobiales bacterium]
MNWIEGVEPGTLANSIGPKSVGGSRWLFVVIPPYSEPRPTAVRQGVDEDGWHTTPTIDFDYLLDGELDLLLDHDTVRLQKGDVVIQQATRHAWRNPGSQSAVLLALLHRP